MTAKEIRQELMGKSIICQCGDSRVMIRISDVQYFRARAQKGNADCEPRLWGLFDRYGTGRFFTRKELEELIEKREIISNTNPWSCMLEMNYEYNIQLVN